MKFTELLANFVVSFCVRCMPLMTYILFISYNPNITVISEENYRLVLYGLGGAHNTFSFLVLVTYFLSNHPSPPSITGWIESIK